jgi:hypothetical protein
MHRYILLVFVLVFASVSLSGCGIAARMEDRQEYVKARQQYEGSLAVYRNCLAANSSNIKACEGRRLASEADERAFTNISGANRQH